MTEVFENLEHVPLWVAASRGDPPDGDTPFRERLLEPRLDNMK